ncbi:MAG TPA: metallophosphoesterase [Gammaproteobacteria bacterium]|nr:metallophosphoesterase [Gammaproteobacteria bacterium]
MTQLIQISDLHLYANANNCLDEINTQAALEAVLGHVQQQQPELLVMSGDLSQDGSLLSYQRLAKTVSAMHCPVYWVQGNHDDIDNASIGLKSTNLSADRTILINGWQIVLLDSTAPGLDDGFIGSVDFKHLKQCLIRHPNLPALIVMHHPPVAVGCYMDAVKVINDQQFLTSLYSFPQVRLVLFGHIHQEFQAIHQGIHFLGAPATSVQFVPQVEKFAIDTSLTPGYRWINLQPEGNFSTGIIRI